MPTRAILIAIVLAFIGCGLRADGTPRTEPGSGSSAARLRSTAWLAARSNDPDLVVIHVDRDRAEQLTLTLTLTRS